MKAIKLVFLSTLFALSACSPPPMEETHNWEGEIVEVRAVAHDTSYATNAACQALFNDEIERDGCAGWSLGNDRYCEVHITRPRNQSDSNAEKLSGHEFHHCIWGNYHPE